MWTVMKKELKNYFLSPVGYVFIGVCLAMCSVFFYITAIAQGAIHFEYMYYYVAQMLVFIIPILSMRMFAEERKNGTEILLATSPKSTTSIVLGKFLSAILVIVIMELCTIMYFGILCYFGMPDIIVGLLAMCGTLLLSMSYLSFGMLISSITENQIIAGIITLISLVVMWFLPNISASLEKYSLLQRFYNFPSGVISISDLTVLITTTLLFITMTILFMERRKFLK